MTGALGIDNVDEVIVCFDLEVVEPGVTVPVYYTDGVIYGGDGVGFGHFFQWSSLWFSGICLAHFPKWQGVNLKIEISSFHQSFSFCDHNIASVFKKRGPPYPPPPPT